MTSPGAGGGALQPDLVPARERAIGVLTDHFAEDRLSIYEFERRLDLLYAATTVEQLDQLVREVAPPPSSATSAVPAWEQPARSSIASVAAAATRRLVAVMGTVRRGGSWAVPARLDVVAVMGEAVLDLRDAVFASSVTRLHVTAVMSNVTIIVPPGLHVNEQGSAFMGSFEHDAVDATGPEAPQLMLVGFACMADVKVVQAEPGD